MEFIIEIIITPIVELFILLVGFMVEIGISVYEFIFRKKNESYGLFKRVIFGLLGTILVLLIPFLIIWCFLIM